jgi:hypothetical protein
MLKSQGGVPALFRCNAAQNVSVKESVNNNSCGITAVYELLLSNGKFIVRHYQYRILGINDLHSLGN